MVLVLKFLLELVIYIVFQISLVPGFLLWFFFAFKISPFFFLLYIIINVFSSNSIFIKRILFSQNKGNKARLRYRDYAQARWGGGAHSAYWVNEIFRETYIQSDICGKVSLRTDLVAEGQYYLSAYVDGHHISFDVNKITVDGVYRGKDYVVFAEGDM